MEGSGIRSVCSDAFDIPSRNYFDVARAGDTESDYCLITKNYRIGSEK